MKHKSLALALATLGTALVVADLPRGASAPQGGGGWTLVAWNDLGMHCMDGDYSVWSILPPFNTLQAQLVDSAGDLVTDASGITVTYRAAADPTGSINTTSRGKTNYWQYADVLFGGSNTPDTGLAGHDMPGPTNDPQPMAFDASTGTWHAEGIPLTPYDDALHFRTYPLWEVVATDAGGNVLATTTPVAPVSDELDCSLCHGSGAAPAAMPAAGWVYDRSHERDHRLNVLRIHDDRQLGNPAYDGALAQKGYRASGLYDTVVLDGTPILCAGCHGSNALPGTGLAGISSLTEAVHAGHADVVDPLNGMTLEDSANRASCYRCHPGSETGCLRGAMGAAVADDTDLAMQCQSCHGSMEVVGDPARDGWLDEPNCQNCHTGDAVSNNGQIRYTSVFEPDGSMRVAVNDRFATEPDVPAAGYSLYRFSRGHGGLNCEACHGSTHAVYPASHPNDNLQSLDLQGHTGTIAECTTCHNGSPNTVSGGPHGLHAFSQRWVDDHGDEVEDNGSAQCAVCHGTDFRGTVLSRTHDDRSFTADGRSVTFAQGENVGCWSCHQGPNDDDWNGDRAPVALDGSLTVGDDPAAVTLVATDADGDALTLRILDQPAFGRVGLVGTTATYAPNPGFAGTDSFTFTASDGDREAAPATVSVTRLANASTYGRGYARPGGQPAHLGASGPPRLGDAVTLTLDNVTGTAGLWLIVASEERAHLDTRFGGVLLSEPANLVLSPLASGGGSVVYGIADDPSLIGLTLHAQALQFDPAAAYRLSFSDGLTLAHGL